MSKLSYSTGVQEFQVEGGTIAFNPADPVFVHRLFDCFANLSQIQDAGEQDNEALARDPEKLFRIIEQREADMRNRIDAVFGPDASGKIFPSTGLYALADGLPVWCNFMLAVMDLVDSSVVDAETQGNPRIDFYMNKYSKYLKK